MALDRRGQSVSGEISWPTTDRATRFIARIDLHLPTLKDDTARRDFLDRQLDGWERRYARFLATGGECEPVRVANDPPQAADFLLTITGLATRRSALDEHGIRGEHA
jgi:hypothetical protein